MERTPTYANAQRCSPRLSRSRVPCRRPLAVFGTPLNAKLRVPRRGFARLSQTRLRPPERKP
eukprot:5069236-Lingulodinium_polyedra.AAC.1